MRCTAGDDFFPHFLGYLFNRLIVPFTIQKHFNFMKACSLIFGPISWVSRFLFIKSLFEPIIKCTSYSFFWKFQVKDWNLWFLGRDLCADKERRITCHFSIWRHQFFQHHMLKMLLYFFSPMCTFGLCQKPGGCWCKTCSWVLDFISLVNESIFMLVLCWFYCYVSAV